MPSALILNVPIFYRWYLCFELANTGLRSNGKTRHLRHNIANASEAYRVCTILLSEQLRICLVWVSQSSQRHWGFVTDWPRYKDHLELGWAYSLSGSAGGMSGPIWPSGILNPCCLVRICCHLVSPIEAGRFIYSWVTSSTTSRNAYRKRPWWSPPKMSNVSGYGTAAVAWCHNCRFYVKPPKT